MKNVLRYLMLFSLCLLLTGCQIESSQSGSQTADPSGLAAAEHCTVHFIDCGKADSILVLADGEAMLIDAGYEENADTIITYLNNQGVTKLKYVVLTHGDKDHVGGMAKVLSAFSVEKLLVNPRSEKSEWYYRMVDVVDQKKIATEVPSVGTKLTLGNGEITVCAPGEEALAEKKDNDSSLVLYYKYGSRSFYFMGDAGETTEKEMRNDGYTYVCDVLKVGHHGKSDTSTKKFLKAVAPLYAVITCGEIQGEDESGEPDSEVLSRLNDFNVEVFRSDECGTVVFETDGTKIGLRSKEK